MATYYISMTGSDGAAGTSTGTAWRNMSKLSGAFNPGDIVQFERDGVWRGAVDITSAGITVQDYGSGVAKPIISGGVVVTGFSVFSGNTYSASLASLVGVPPFVTFTSAAGVTTVLILGSGSGTLTANQYFHAAGVLYVHLGGTNPSTGTVETTSVKPFTTHGSNFTFRNLDIRYGADSALNMQDGCGQLVTACDFKYCTMLNAGIAGTVGLYRGTPIGTTASRVTGCSFDYLANEMVYVVNTKNVEIDTNTGTNIGGMVGDQQTDGIQFENTSAGHNSDGLWVHNNYITIGTATVKGGILVNIDTGAAGASSTGIVEYNTCIGGNWGIAPHASGLTVRNNILTGQTAANAAGMWIDPTSTFTNLVITYNLIYNCYFGINGGNGANPRQVTLCQNTIVDCTRAHLILDSPTWGTIKNNILWNTGAAPTLRCMYLGSVSGAGSLVIDKNIYNTAFSSYLFLGGLVDASTLAAWKAGNGGRDAGSFSSDPLFVNAAGRNYNLTSTSPARSAGDVIGGISQVNTDIGSQPFSATGRALSTLLGVG